MISHCLSDQVQLPSLMIKNCFHYLAVASFLAFTSSALQAQIVSINFGPTSTNLASGDQAGVVLAGNWNNLTGTSNPSDTFNLLDSTGVATTLDLTSFAGGKPDGGLLGLGLNNGTLGRDYSSTNPTVIQMDGFIFGENDSTPITFSIGDIDSSFTGVGYNVYVYYDRPNDTDSNITITPNSGGGGATQAANDTTDGPFNGTDAYSYAEGNNYVVFSGLTAASFDVSIVRIGTDGGARPTINGIQIVAVPEPTGAALMTAGGILLLGFWRRRK